MNGRLNRTIEKLQDKDYRDAYVEAHVKIGIPHQIRALREQEGRKWSQAELGRRSGKPANVISRLEDPESGGNTIRTCLEMAAAFDVALLVKFVSYSRFLREFEDVSPQALEVPSFTSDPGLIHPAGEEFPSNISNYQDAIVTQAESHPIGEEVLPIFLGTNTIIVKAANVSRYYYLDRAETIQASNISGVNTFQELVSRNYSEAKFIGGKVYGQEETYIGRKFAAISGGT